MGRPKKKINRKSLNDMYKGDEPVFENMSVEEFESRIGWFYSWYNYMWDFKRTKKALLTYAKEHRKNSIKAIQGCNEAYISSTAGFLARMYMQGAPVQGKKKEYLDNFIDSLKENERNEEAKPARKSVHELTKIKAKEHCSTIEGMLDDYYLSGYKEKPDLYTEMKNMGIKPGHAEVLNDHFKPIVRELKKALSDIKENKKTDLSEAYEYIDKTILENELSFYESVLKNCIILVDNIKKQKKPRKKRSKKRKTKEALVSKLKYMESFDELKLTSENPQKLIGAKAAFLFNTKNNTLHLYIAETTEGLTVKGAVISQFNSNKSEIKRIGKQLKVLPELQKKTKLQSIKHFRNIKAKINNCTGRTTNDMIILKVF